MHSHATAALPITAGEDHNFVDIGDPASRLGSKNHCPLGN